MPSKQYWQHVCYGNGKFVAISYDTNVFAYSSDGITWTQGTMPSSQILNSICYGNDKFMVMPSSASTSPPYTYTYDNIIFTEISTPSSAWFVIDDTKLGQENYSISENNMPSSQYWTSICYGDDKFVAIISDSDVFAYSSDGINWTEGTLPSSQAWDSVCYGNDKFVAIARSNIFAYSSDGINWTEGNMPSEHMWSSVCYGNDKFVVVSYQSNVFAYSSDGINWTEGTMSSSQGWMSVCYGNDKFVVVSYLSNVFAYSSDGINWTEGNMLTEQAWRLVCYGNDKFVAIGNDSNAYAYSTDGINWTQGTMPSSQILNSICYGNDKFVIIAGNNVFAYSCDGINWTQGTMPSEQAWQSVCYGNSKFVVIARNSNIFASISDFTPAGLIQYAAPNPELTWGNILNKPTSISDYGITNVYTKEEINNLYNEIIESLNKSNEIATNFNSEVTVTIPSDLLDTYKTNLLAAAELNRKLDDLLHSLGLNDEKINDIINLYKNRSIKIVPTKDPLIKKNVHVFYCTYKDEDDNNTNPCLDDSELAKLNKSYELDNINNISDIHVIDNQYYPGYRKIVDELGSYYEFSGWNRSDFDGPDLENFVVGSTFKLGKYQVESETPWPIEWEIVHQTDDYQIAMTKQIIDLRCFDANESTNTNSARKNYGNNNWQYSNIKKFLNSDQASWYSSQHQYDAPPNSSNVDVNAYDTHKGFLYYWSNEDKALLKDMTLTLANPSIDGGGSYTWTGKVWLPTYTQMGFGQNNSISEGTQFSKFTDNNSRIKTINKYCAENNPYCKANNKPEGTDWYYWMSSMYPSTSECVYGVTGGSEDYFNAHNNGCGLAPCICLPRKYTAPGNSPV